MEEILRHLVGLIKALTKLKPGFDQMLREKLEK